MLPVSHVVRCPDFYSILFFKEKTKASRVSVDTRSGFFKSHFGRKSRTGWKYLIKTESARWKEETLSAFDYDLEASVDFGRTLTEAAT